MTKKNICMASKYVKNYLTNSIKHFYDLKDFEELVEYLEYEKNKEIQYSADMNDSLFKNMFCLAFMFKKNYFV